jgi:large subunit ribosomal protein L21
MYAVLDAGGRQFRIEPGKHVVLEKLPKPEGEAVEFAELLLVVDDVGTTHVGHPFVDGARAVGKVVRQARAKKILVFKYKPKKNYRRRQGHRQYQTHVLIESIELSS